MSKKENKREKRGDAAGVPEEDGEGAAPTKKRRRKRKPTMPKEMQPEKTQRPLSPESDDTERLANTVLPKIMHRIAYITFKTLIISEEEIGKAMTVVQEAQDAKADIINIGPERIKDLQMLWNHMKRKMIGYVGCRKKKLVTFLTEKTASEIGRAVGEAFIQSKGWPAGPFKDICVLTQSCGPITIKNAEIRESPSSHLLLIDCWYVAKPGVTDPDIKYIDILVALMVASVPPTQTSSIVPRIQDISSDSEQDIASCCTVGSLKVKSNTPLYKNLFRNTQKERGLWSFIYKCYAKCNGGNVEMRRPADNGDNGDNAEMLPLKVACWMEGLLEVALGRRKQALKHLCDSGKVSNCYITHEIPEADMSQVVYKKWQNNVYEWMNQSTQTTYQNLKRAGKASKKSLPRRFFFRKKVQAQAFRKKAFDTYLEQLCGYKLLLHKLIQLPLVQDPNSAAPPMTPQHFATSLASFIKDLELH